MPPSSPSAPLRRHRLTKLLPHAYSHAIADEAERTARLLMRDLDACVAATPVDLDAVQRVIGGMVSARNADFARIFYLVCGACVSMGCHQAIWAARA